MTAIPERVAILTLAAFIEGPASVGPVLDPAAVNAAVLRWAGSLYEKDPVKRAWIDAHVLKTIRQAEPRSEGVPCVCRQTQHCDCDQEVPHE